MNLHQRCTLFMMLLLGATWPAAGAAPAVHVYTPAQWPQALSGDLQRPAGGAAPLVLLVHGGGWHSGRRAHMDDFAAALHTRGYATFSIDYRLLPAQHPAQLEDVLQALHWLGAQAEALNIDGQRLAVWGYSAGAHLATLAALDPRAPRVRAIVAGGLPADLTALDDASMVRELMGGDVASRGAAHYRAASPLYRVHAAAPPTFLFHARWDRVVPPQQARAMQAALAAAGVPNALHWLQGRGHVLGFFFNDAAVDAALDFLDRYLKAPPAASTDR